MHKPSLARHLAIIIYDSLLLVAVLLLAMAVLTVANGKAIGANSLVFYFYLLPVSFVFYGWFWTHGGQTLGMRAWRTKLLTTDGNPVTWHDCTRRFAMAIISLAIFGIGFIWQLFDKNHRTWHDIASNTALFIIPK